VRTVGKRILENVPGIISALEPLTEIHPFLKGTVHFISGILSDDSVVVYLPFKYIYQQ
jgi:hypothetical protein